MSAELVGIELQLRGYDGVMSDIRALDQMLNGFRGKKNRLQIEADISSAKKEILALEGELNKLNSVKLTLAEQGKSSEALNNKIKETRERLRDARQAVKEFQYALKNLSSMSFQQVFNKISSAVAHLGSAMQSAGNALTRMTNPFANFTKGIVMGAGYKALNKFTEGLENGFSRYDTMKKYPKLMAEFETKSYSAQQSINDLDKAVRGLPTSLNDMVDLSQRFTMTMGDMERGTKLAIATNNAFLASMSTDTQKYQGMMQMQDVIGGKNMNAREWQALAQSMKPALRMMGQDLGKSGKELQEWVSAVMQGKVSNEEFLDALEKTGTGMGRAAQAAQRSKDTWESFFANIGNASSRMTAGIIESMDEVVKTLGLKDADGQTIESVNRLLADRITPAIDDMTGSIKGWIKAHPDEIIDFFKSLKQIDVKGLISGFGKALLGVANLIQRIAGFLNGKDLSWVGKGMLYGNILGNFLTISGGLLKGSRGIIGGIGAGGYKLFKGIKGIKKQGFMSWLISQLAGEDPKATEKAVETAAKTAPKMGKFMTGLSKVFTGWAEIATMVGGTALVGWGTFKAFKSMFNDLKEIAEISKEIDWEVASVDLLAMGGFITAFIAVGTKVGSALGAQGLAGGGIFAGLTAIFAGTFWADMAMIKRGFKAIADATGYIQDAVDNLNELTSIGNVPQIKKNAQQAVAVFNAITDILQIERNNPVTGEATGGLKELDSKAVKTVKNVTSSIENIKKAVDALNELSATKMKLGGLAAVMAGSRNAFTQLSNLLIDMPSVFKDATASGWAETMSGTMTNLKSVFDSLVGKNGIMSMLPKLVQEMAELTKGNVFTDLKPRMEELGQTLTDIYTSLQGIGAGEYFATNIDHFRAGIKSLKFAIKHLQEVGSMKVDNSLVTKIQDIIGNIQSAFDQTAIAELNATITTFAIAIKVALTTLEMLNGDIEVDVTVKLSKNFYTSKDKVIKEIDNARKQIKDHCKPVKGSIRVSLVFSVISNVGAALAKITRDRQAVERQVTGASTPITPHIATGGRVSRGGILYRSGGGSIFKPRGTDKIPAMLTEGEYVQKKQAVDFFGIDFMRKINNMDVRGAMDALLTKAGTSIGVGRQSIVNNTVNNNQRITQNINTNNPNFAKARMGRFVGAL